MKRPISANSQSPNPLQAPKQPTLRHPRPKHPTRLNHSPTLEPFPAPEAPVGNKSPRPTSTTRPTHYQPFIPAALRNVPSSTIAGTSNQSSEKASGSNSAYTGSFSNSTVAKTPLNAPRSSATTRGLQLRLNIPYPRCQLPHPSHISPSTTLLFRLTMGCNPGLDRILTQQLFKHRNNVSHMANQSMLRTRKWSLANISQCYHTFLYPHHRFNL